jgi:hypothetical protein
MIKVTVAESPESVTLSRKVAGAVLSETVPVGTPFYLFLSESIQRLAQSPKAQHPYSW